MIRTASFLFLIAFITLFLGCSAEVKTSDGKPLTGSGNGGGSTGGGTPLVQPQGNGTSANNGVSLDGTWIAACAPYSVTTHAFRKSSLVVSGNSMKRETGFYSDSECKNVISGGGVEMYNEHSGTIQYHDDFTSRANYAIVEYSFTDEEGKSDLEYFMIRVEGTTAYMGETSNSKVAVSEPDSTFPYKKQ